ncbi:MAG: hypothetical protein RL885_06755 [Planctomycetota bacterium]
MDLTPIDLGALTDEPLPSDVSSFLVEADSRIRTFLRSSPANSVPAFHPSDHVTAYRALCRLDRLGYSIDPLCEWGCGFGVVTGLGAKLGVDAYGIEIEPELVGEAQQLLLDFEIVAEIIEGSFIPRSYGDMENWSDPDFNTIQDGTDAYDDLGLEIRDFDLVYAYPWPGEEEMYFELFERYGAPGSILLMYHGVEEMLAFRK